MSLNSEATPTIGRVKSLSRKPTARSMARLGARPMPSVVRRLCFLRSDGMALSSLVRSALHKNSITKARKAKARKERPFSFRAFAFRAFVIRFFVQSRCGRAARVAGPGLQGSAVGGASLVRVGHCGGGRDHTLNLFSL